MTFAIDPNLIAPDHSVGWIEKGGPMWAAVAEVQESAIIVLGATGRQRALKFSVIAAHCALNVNEAQSQLVAENLSLPVHTCWEGLVAHFAQERFSAAQAVSFLAQPLDRTPLVWQMLWDNTDYFARAGRTEFRARSQQEVVEEKERLEEKKREAEILDKLPELRAHYDHGSLSYAEILEKPGIHEVAKHLAYGNKMTIFSEQGQKTIEQFLFELHTDQNCKWPLSWRLAQQLGDTDPWATGEPRIAQHSQWLTTFSDEPVAFEGCSLLQPQTRLWAIDDAETIDRDDAIGFTNQGEDVLVEIAVADVVSGISGRKQVQYRASKLATTIYLPTANIPMLPFPVGAGAHSLSADQVRPAFLLRCLLDGQTGAVKVAPQVVRGLLQLDGVAAYEAIEQNRQQPDNWRIGVEIADTLHQARLAAGASDVRLPDVMVRATDGHPTALQLAKPWLGARKVVREMMILANSQFAKILADHKLAAPFRGMEKRRHNIVARVDIKPYRHVGLGVEQYLYATSPIRRYSDVLTQLQLASLFGERPLSDQKMYKAIRDCEVQFQASKRWMDAASKYWKLRYLEANNDIKLFALPEPRSTDIEGTTRVRISPLNLLTYIKASLPDNDELVPVTLEQVDADLGELRLVCS